jgi:hypothetical protein
MYCWHTPCAVSTSHFWRIQVVPPSPTNTTTTTTTSTPTLLTPPPPPSPHPLLRHRYCESDEEKITELVAKIRSAVFGDAVGDAPVEEESLEPKKLTTQVMLAKGAREDAKAVAAAVEQLQGTPINVGCLLCAVSLCAVHLEMPERPPLASLSSSPLPSLPHTHPLSFSFSQCACR